MLEIAPNRFIVKSKIIEMKLAEKDGKHWVVFYCGKVDGQDQSVFSADQGSAEKAKSFLTACAASL